VYSIKRVFKAVEAVMVEPEIVSPVAIVPNPEVIEPESKAPTVTILELPAVGPLVSTAVSTACIAALIV